MFDLLQTKLCLERQLKDALYSLMFVDSKEQLRRSTESLLNTLQLIHSASIEVTEKTFTPPAPQEVEKARVIPENLTEPKVAPYVIEGFKYVESQRKNDCGVVAIANVCQMSYSKAKIEAFTHGWSSTCGIVHGFIEVICKKHRISATLRPDVKGMSVQFLADHPFQGVFLVYCDGHVMPMINGKLFNWTQSSYKIVNEVYELHPEM